MFVPTRKPFSLAKRCFPLMLLLGKWLFCYIGFLSTEWEKFYYAREKHFSRLICGEVEYFTWWSRSQWTSWIAHTAQFRSWQLALLLPILSACSCKLATDFGQVKAWRPNNISLLLYWIPNLRQTQDLYYRILKIWEETLDVFQHVLTFGNKNSMPKDLKASLNNMLEKDLMFFRGQILEVVDHDFLMI
jgi:hypothetical protein